MVGNIRWTRTSREARVQEQRSRRVSVNALLGALRPLQWTKNAIVLAAVVFSGELFDAEQLARAGVAAVIFCIVSSGVYLINDLRDVEADRAHSQKRHRPIAAGLVTPTQGILVAATLFLIAFVAACQLGISFLLVVLTYIALMTAYTYGLKRLAILDVFAIASGFVLRAVAGAVAINAPISPWLYVCTMLLALFIGFGKRRHELMLLEGEATRHRANLDIYSVSLLDQIIGIVASSTVMVYSLYTFDAPNVPRNHTMMLTIPFVVYAIFRYLYLLQRRDLGGAPEVLLFTDIPLLACIVGWAFGTVAILYFML
ncbi:MAG: decaprenyl-phosphate phosphoribosyltransferase [Chloroflexota bacterium]|nr:decaprenyl-phosphate phosphoribosyltransferase [Chloroflexota bacterium]